jgi:transcriptional regulator with XRE-family HTH domain
MLEKKALLLRFGQRVRQLRHDAGLSQEAFADICGLDRTYIGGIERGERNVALWNLVVISKALSLTVSSILSGVDDSDA